jgi:putative transcriptional regulator
MQSKIPVPFLVAFLLAALALMPWRPAGAQDSNQPVLLVANPLLAEMYAHTVLIAIPMGDNRHAGLIINRPTERSLASLFPEHEPSRQVLSPVYFGGPVMTNSLFAVVRSDKAPGDGSLPFVPGLFLVAHAKTIDEIIERQPNEARYYVGFVAWKPGELDEELKKGFWYVMLPDAELLFRDTTNGLWEELVRRAGAARVRAKSSGTADEARG